MRITAGFVGVLLLSISMVLAQPPPAGKSTQAPVGAGSVAPASERSADTRAIGELVDVFIKAYNAKDSQANSSGHGYSTPRGGFAEGLMYHDGDRCVIKSTGSRADGTRVAVTSTITILGKDRMRWESSDRTVGDAPVPETDQCGRVGDGGFSQSPSISSFRPSQQPGFGGAGGRPSTLPSGPGLGNRPGIGQGGAGGGRPSTLPSGPGLGNRPGAGSIGNVNVVNIYAEPVAQPIVIEQVSAEGVPQTVSVPALAYDYSRPLDTVSAPPPAEVADPAVAKFDAAREAFRSGDYARALELADEALKVLPPPASAAGSEATPPTPAPAAPAVKPGVLAGKWNAQPAQNTTIDLQIADDDTFTWTVTSKGKPRKITGKLSLADDVLTLAQAGQGSAMVDRIAWQADNRWSFRVMGTAPEDPGLVFSR